MSFLAKPDVFLIVCLQVRMWVYNGGEGGHKLQFMVYKVPLIKLTKMTWLSVHLDRSVKENGESRF